jgi:hypothetical protein
MNGMHQESAWAYSFDSNDYSASFQYELAPTPTLAQISLAGYFEFDDQAHVDAGFTGCTFLDEHGVTRTESFKDIDYPDAVIVFGRNGLASASYQIRVSNCAARVILNFFFWDRVF